MNAIPDFKKFGQTAKLHMDPNIIWKYEVTEVTFLLSKPNLREVKPDMMQCEVKRCQNKSSGIICSNILFQRPLSLITTNL